MLAHKVPSNTMGFTFQLVMINLFVAVMNQEKKGSNYSGKISLALLDGCKNGGNSHVPVIDPQLNETSHVCIDPNGLLSVIILGTGDSIPDIMYYRRF